MTRRATMTVNATMTSSRPSVSLFELQTWGLTNFFANSLPTFCELFATFCQLFTLFKLFHTFTNFSTLFQNSEQNLSSHPVFLLELGKPFVKWKYFSNWFLLFILCKIESIFQANWFLIMITKERIWMFSENRLFLHPYNPDKYNLHFGVIQFAILTNYRWWWCLRRWMPVWDF